MQPSIHKYYLGIDIDLLLSVPFFSGSPIAKNFCRGNWGEFQGRADVGKWGGGAWAIGDPSPNVKIFTNRSPSQGKGRGREAALAEEPSTPG